MSSTELPPLFDIPEDERGEAPSGHRRLGRHAAGVPDDGVVVERSVTVSVTVTEKFGPAFPPAPAAPAEAERTSAPPVPDAERPVRSENPEPVEPDWRDEPDWREEPFDDQGAAMALPVPAWAERLAVFDLETTGIDVETSRIVTANISLLDATGTAVSRLDWLADPGIDIPEQATAVHGITTEHARSAGRPAGEVVGEIVAELRRALEAGYAIVVYNAPYDITLLNREALRHGVPPLEAPSPVIDPLVIDKQVDRYRKGKRTLEVSAAHYGVELLDAHDAGADAIAAGRVAQAIAARFAAELDLSPTALHEAQAAWHDAQCDSFEDYMRRTKNPSFTSRRGWPETPRRT